MINTYIQPPPDVTVPTPGKKVHAAQLAAGPPEEIRQTTAIGDPDARDAVAKVTNAAPGATDYGVVTRRVPKGLTLAAFNFASSSDQDLAPAAGAGKVNKIWKLWLVVDGDTTITIKDGPTTKLGPFSFAQGGVIGWPMDEEPWFITSVNTPFRLTLGSLVQCGGIIGYTQE